MPQRLLIRALYAEFGHVDDERDSNITMTILQRLLSSLPSVPPCMNASPSAAVHRAKNNTGKAKAKAAASRLGIEATTLEPHKAILLCLFFGDQVFASRVCCKSLDTILSEEQRAAAQRESDFKFAEVYATILRSTVNADATISLSPSQPSSPSHFVCCLRTSRRYNRLVQLDPTAMRRLAGECKLHVVGISSNIKPYLSYPCVSHSCCLTILCIAIF